LSLDENLDLKQKTYSDEHGVKSGSDNSNNAKKSVIGNSSNIQPTNVTNKKMDKSENGKK
jgi:hypothetical protein